MRKEGGGGREEGREGGGEGGRVIALLIFCLRVSRLATL